MNPRSTSPRGNIPKNKDGANTELPKPAPSPYTKLPPGETWQEFRLVGVDPIRLFLTDYEINIEDRQFPVSIYTPAAQCRGTLMTVIDCL